MCGCGAQAQRIEAEWERTNVADVDDVEGLLRLPGLGLLDQVAARLILAGLQRVLLFLRLGVVVRPQLCHLPSRQLKLPTQRDRNGEPSASGNSSSLPPPIRNRNVRGSGAHPLPVRQRTLEASPDTPVPLRTRAATPDPSRTPRHRAHHRCKSSILSQLRSNRRHSAHSFALSWQYCRHLPLEPAAVSDNRLKLFPHKLGKKEMQLFSPSCTRAGDVRSALTARRRCCSSGILFPLPRETDPLPLSLSLSSAGRTASSSTPVLVASGSTRARGAPTTRAA